MVKMPKVGCNGYSLFAEQMKPALEQKLGKQLMRFNDVVKAAAPYWTKLSEEEKRRWKERAKDYKRSDDFVSKRREARLQHFESREKRKEFVEETGLDSEFEEEDDDSDFEDPNELPGPVQNKATMPHSDLFNCLPGGDFTWKKRGMSPSELGELMEMLAPLKGGGSASNRPGTSLRQYKTTNSYYRSDTRSVASSRTHVSTQSDIWYNKRRSNAYGYYGGNNNGNYYGQYPHSYHQYGPMSYETPPRMRKQKEQQREFYPTKRTSTPVLNDNVEETDTKSHIHSLPDISVDSSDSSDSGAVRTTVTAIDSSEKDTQTTESKVTVKSTVTGCSVVDDKGPVDVFNLVDGDTLSILRILKVSQAVM